MYNYQPITILRDFVTHIEFNLACLPSIPHSMECSGCNYQVKIPGVPTNLLGHLLSVTRRSSKLEACAINIIMHPHLQSYSITHLI